MALQADNLEQDVPEKGGRKKVGEYLCRDSFPGQVHGDCTACSASTEEGKAWARQIVISSWSSTIMKNISRIPNEQRGSLPCVWLKYLIWFKRWSAEHLWFQNSSLCNHSFGALLLCTISFKLEDWLELLCVRGSQWYMSISHNTLTPLGLAHIYAFYPLTIIC